MLAAFLLDLNIRLVGSGDLLGDNTTEKDAQGASQELGGLVGVL